MRVHTNPLTILATTRRITVRQCHTRLAGQRTRKAQPRRAAHLRDANTRLVARRAAARAVRILDAHFGRWALLVVAAEAAASGVGAGWRGYGEGGCADGDDLGFEGGAGGWFGVAGLFADLVLGLCAAALLIAVLLVVVGAVAGLWVRLSAEHVFALACCGGIC